MSQINDVTPIEVVSPERHIQLVTRVELENRRRELKTQGGSPILIDYEHIQRHFKGSGVFGDTIEAWENTESMLMDPEVWEFVKESVLKIPSKTKPGEALVFKHDFSFKIGHDSVARIDNLPIDCRIAIAERSGYYINVTDAVAPETSTLQIMIVRDKYNPARYILLSAWAGSVDAPKGSMKNPDWKDYAFYV